MRFSQEYSGASRYLDRVEVLPHTLIVGVWCAVGDVTDPQIALLDTAAEWCVLSSHLIEPLGLQNLTGLLSWLNSRFGTCAGHLERMPVRFRAERGEHLVVDATWFVSPDWSGPMVIGWKGCLERMRFAFDPGQERFFFAEL